MILMNDLFRRLSDCLLKRYLNSVHYGAFLHAGERDIKQILDDLLDASYAIDEEAERLVGTQCISKGRELKLMMREGKASMAKPISAIIIVQ